MRSLFVISMFLFAIPNLCTTTESDSALYPIGRLAVKGLSCSEVGGSHGLRNVILGGLAGALLSKEQCEVLDVVDYAAKIGQKFHGKDLQTIQLGGTKVVILDKKVKPEDVAKACH